MSQAKAGDTVEIHYTGTLDDGTQFDTSADRDPLEFELGRGHVIPGIEKAVKGMSIGDSKTVRIEPDDAYGPRHDQLVQVVARSDFPDELSLHEGAALKAKSPDGKVTQFTVTAVTDETVTVDANHPLAGRALNFAIELVNIS